MVDVPSTDFITGWHFIFPTIKPSAAKYEKESKQKFELTFDKPEWYPRSTQFYEQEAAFSDSNGCIREPVNRNKDTSKNFFTI